MVLKGTGFVTAQSTNSKVPWPIGGTVQASDHAWFKSVPQGRLSLRNPSLCDCGKLHRVLKTVGNIMVPINARQGPKS